MCYAGGFTVTFEKIVSFLAQMVVDHKSRRIKLLFNALSLRTYMRHLPIYARFLPEFLECYIMLLLGIGLRNGPTFHN